MKKVLFVFILIFSNNLFAQNNLKELDISTLEQKAQASKFKSLRSNVPNTYDLKYHRCEWIINPDTNYIQGSVTSYFEPTVSGFNKMQFDLAATLTIDSVIYKDTLLEFGQLLSDVLEITFPQVLTTNTLDSVTIYYKGVPINKDFGSFMKSKHNDTSIIWTLSEPFGAKDWWPCKQSLNDKIDSVDIIVTTPKINRVASNGILKSETIKGENKIYHWKTKYPITTYLIAIAVTNYAAYSDYVPMSTGDSLEVLNYVYPENLTTAKKETPEIIKIIKLFDSLTITYPFVNEKYGHAQFGWGGGMEHQTMSFMVHFDFALQAHECAHQWFGNHVTCGSWEDIWLNEGFATYFEGLAQQRYNASNWENWKQHKIKVVTAEPNGSVLCDDTTNVSRIFNGRLSYYKASYLLHMLRWKLGDSLFFLSLKNYLNNPALAGGYAKTPDLKKQLETTTGHDLTNFFNQWYYGQGHPSYQISYVQKGRELTVIAKQKQSHSSVSFFEMPIPIKFIGFERDTTIVFNHTYSGQNFSTTINFPIRTAEFDPELWLLSANNQISGTTDYEIIPVELTKNLVDKELSITLKLNNPKELRFTILNLSGKIIFETNQLINEGATHQTIDVSSLSNGVYFFKVTGDNINTVEKFIKINVN